MEYARVKYLNSGEWATIPTRIIRNFSASFEPKQCYVVEHNGKFDAVTISFVRATMEEIANEVQSLANRSTASTSTKDDEKKPISNSSRIERNALHLITSLEESAQNKERHKFHHGQEVIKTCGADKPKPSKRLRKRYLLESETNRAVSGRTLNRWKKPKFTGHAPILSLGINSQNVQRADKKWESSTECSTDSTECSDDECTDSDSDSGNECPKITDRDIESGLQKQMDSCNLKSGKCNDNNVLSGFFEHYSFEAEDAIENIEGPPEEDFEQYSCSSESEIESTSESSDDSSVDHCHNSGSSEDKSDFIFNTKELNGDRMMFPTAELTISDVLLMITVFCTTKRITRKDQDDLIELIKTLAGPAFASWHVSHYRRSKIYNPPRNKMTSHFFCENKNCRKILISRPVNRQMSENESIVCNDCEKVNVIMPRSENQFMSIDVEYQLKILLDEPNIQENLLEMVKNLHEKSDDSIIRDVYDGELYKAVQRKQPGTLTYNMNADGAPLYKSSKQSFWPLQLHINELSPSIRFKHIILAGLFLTTNEPKAVFLNSYFSTFLSQTRKLMEKGITFTRHLTGERVNVKFACLLAPMDSVARPVAQNRLQFNGHYGCSWCYHYGLYIESSMRYPLLTNEDQLRSHTKYREDVLSAVKTEKIIKGVKGPCSFMSVSHFDCVWSFPYEYMHALLLGVVKALWGIWTTPDKKGYLTAADRRGINERSMRIKRPQEIHRLPRTVDNTAKWKATEWKSWLLYDSVPCLEGILDDECFQSYLLLVRCSATLLKDNILESEIDQCEMDLLRFVTDCQELYGPAAITFNIHVLLHMCESVRNCGPLWAYSTFPFENGIFHFKKEVRSPNGVAHQIANEYLKRRVLQSKINRNAKTSICRQYCNRLFEPKLYKNYVKTENGVNLIGTGRSNQKSQRMMIRHLNDDKIIVKVFNRCVYNGIKYRSVNYTRAIRTDDTAVKLKDGTIIRIIEFVYVNHKCYIIGQRVDLIPYQHKGQVALNHLFLIKDYDGGEVIVDPNEVEVKVVHFTTGNQNFISIFPNTYEIQ